MNEFDWSSLEQGESVLIGPVVLSRARPFNVNVPGIELNPAHGRVLRRLAITDRRVILEQEGRLQSIPNRRVRKLELRRGHTGRPALGLAALATADGPRVPLDLEGLSPQDESWLRSLFPDARLQERRGWLERLGFSGPDRRDCR